MSVQQAVKEEDTCDEEYMLTAGTDEDVQHCRRLIKSEHDSSEFIDSV